jgi:hypothetical protein
MTHTLENQIRLHKEISKKIDELETQKRQLGIAIMQQMQSKTLQIPGFFVRHCSRFSIKTSLEEARSFNAVRLEEAIDKDKIKALYNCGHQINGVTEIHYIQIQEQP